MSASQIVAMWTSGKYGQADIARIVGTSQGTVHRTLKARGVLNDPVAREGTRARRAASAKQTGNIIGVISPGRPAVWPDCPPELRQDYARLRAAGCRSIDARTALERQQERESEAAYARFVQSYA